MATLVMRSAKREPKLATGSIKKIADAMLEMLGLSDTELSVLLVDDARIQRLNRVHRGKDRPTDVLAFPLDDITVIGGPRLLGDVVISLETALRQARSRGRALFPEVRLLLAHGLLHLIGFDHGNPRDKRRMDAATRRLVRGASRAHPELEAPPRRHRPAGRRRARRSIS